MLPFLTKKKDSANVGLIVKTREPDEKPEDKDDPSAAREACGQAIIDAVKSGSAIAVADAMQDMYEMCESKSDESDAAEPHSYSAQNIKAGQE